MKKSRKELNVYFEKILVTYIADVKMQTAVMKKVYELFSMPFSRSQTILQLNASVYELRDVEIFWVLSAIKSVNDKLPINISAYFTDIETEQYSQMKYQVNDIQFPLVIPAIEISQTQWIAGIYASTLVKWRGSHVRYNKEIQRRVKTVVRGNLTYETISLKTKSVENMVKLFLEGEFIPNVITLNIADTETNFYYDNNDKCLIIKSLDHFDLTDGYHRLVALSKVLEINPQFDLKMELRITNFSEMIASQFIWQEEQRTVMPKRDVESFNANDMANRIAKRINESATCNLSGSITRGGLVDFATFADMVRECFLVGTKDQERKKALIVVTNDIIKSINAITEINPDLLDKKFSVTENRVLVFCCKKFYGLEDRSKIFDLYSALLNYKYTEKEKIVLRNSRPSQSLKLLNDVSSIDGW